MASVKKQTTSSGKPKRGTAAAKPVAHGRKSTPARSPRRLRVDETRQPPDAQRVEAVEQQAATAAILHAMAASPSNVEPVLNAVAEYATRLGGADEGAIFRLEGDRMILAAHFDGTAFGPPPEASIGSAFPVDRSSMAGRAILDK